MYAIDCPPWIYDTIKLTLFLGPSINEVTALGGRGFQGSYDNSTKFLLLKVLTMWVEGVSKSKNCVTSFMDDPFTHAFEKLGRETNLYL